MIDLGISKLALIGVVALVVIGPEKLPKVARTVGTLLGKAQRYVADVKAEVNRSMELEELKKMKESVESAARNVESTIHDTSAEFDKQWSEATAGLESSASVGFNPSDADSIGMTVFPEYKHPKKNFRLKQKAVPQWFKARTGTRTRAQSGAARVARFRPKTKPM
ncbi:Sec-independent protein translocase protein TatB [Macromonas nakdongensis]|uniref:Sec-independent protein translocase protein TatB n=1 Tax=Macromonas nakdongensis TaxID=1843082 RepID=UPI000C31C311|nr:Sec-independent protein translocase protein TatB [Macromonas nakdongensis]